MFVLQTVFISSYLAEPWQVRAEGECECECEGVTECARERGVVGSKIDCLSLSRL